MAHLPVEGEERVLQAPAREFVRAINTKIHRFQEEIVALQGIKHAAKLVEIAGNFEDAHMLLAELEDRQFDLLSEE